MAVLLPCSFFWNWPCISMVSLFSYLACVYLHDLFDALQHSFPKLHQSKSEPVHEIIYVYTCMSLSQPSPFSPVPLQGCFRFGGTFSLLIVYFQV